MKISVEEKKKKYKPIINQLHIGDQFKTFAELCRAVHQVPMTGDSKKTQVDEFLRFFNFKYNGNNYIITDVYDKPLSETPMEKQSKYNQYIYNLILAFLYHDNQCYFNEEHNRNEYCYYMTKTQFYVWLGLINDHYQKYLDNKSAVPQAQMIENTFPDSFDDFCNDMYEIRHNILKNFLGSMQKLNNYRAVNMYDTVIIRRNNSAHSEEATMKMRDAIFALERDVLQEMNVPNMFTVYHRDLSEKFYSLCYKRANEKLGIIYYKKCVKIFAVQKAVNEEFQKILYNCKDIECAKANATALNNAFINAISGRTNGKLDDLSLSDSLNDDNVEDNKKSKKPKSNQMRDKVYNELWLYQQQKMADKPDYDEVDYCLDNRLNFNDRMIRDFKEAREQLTKLFVQIDEITPFIENQFNKPKFLTIY